MADPGATSPDQLDPAPAAARNPALRNSAWLWSLLIVGLVALVYEATWVRVSRSGADHQLIVALAVPWLLWRRRARLLEQPVEPAPWMLPVVLGLSAAWLVSERAAIAVGISALWPLLALAAVWAGAGLTATRKLAFPLLFLYAALPVWSGLIGPLQSLASVAVGWAADLVGLQIIVQGNYIYLPRDTVYIADECSGVQFFTVALAIGALVGEVRSDRWPMRILIIALCAAISIVFNWIRILLTVGAYLHPRFRSLFETLGHENPGWWIFAAGLVVFFIIVHFLPHSPPSPMQAAPSAPVQRARFVSGPLIAMLAASLPPLVSWAMMRSPEFPAVPDGPPQMVGFIGPIPPSQQWQANFHGPSWEHRVGYIGAMQQVFEVYRNGYYDQSEDGELGNVESLLFGASQFTTMATEVRQIPTGPKHVNVNRAQLVAPSGEKWIAVYVYLLDGQLIASYRRTKILSGLRGSTGYPEAGALVVATRCIPDCEQVEGPLDGILLSLLSAYGGNRP